MGLVFLCRPLAQAAGAGTGLREGSWLGQGPTLRPLLPSRGTGGPWLLSQPGLLPFLRPRTHPPAKIIIHNQQEGPGP